MPAPTIFFLARVIRAAIVGLRHEEQPRDVGRRHAQDESQGEGTGGLGGQGRVRAHQDQPQQVVLDQRTGIGHDAASFPASALDDEQRLDPLRRRLAAQAVDDAAAGRGVQPGGGLSGTPPVGQVRAAASTASPSASSTRSRRR